MPSKLHVLQSAPAPRPTTNPYIVMLASGLTAHPDIEFSYFRWGRALFCRVDVFHAHWPEILVSGSTPFKKFTRQVLFACLLIKFALTRTAIVRTVHNLGLPPGIGRRERVLLRLFERMTDLRILINATTTIPDDQPYTTVLHGHYRDWFSQFARSQPKAGQLTYFGLIRPYKGTEALVRVFSSISDRNPSWRLRVAGHPKTQELADELTALASKDDAISLDLRFLSDDELVHIITEAHLVVLPYRQMHNSGSVLTALSLNRPVLVPDNATNRALSEEVGIGWVQTYAGELSEGQVTEAVKSLSLPLEGQPNLSSREWSTSVDLHVLAYARAQRTKHRRKLVN